MIDKERILNKIDCLDGYLKELDEIMPDSLATYKGSIEKKRACERLLQILIETVIDISNMVVSSMKLGIPADEDEVFAKLRKEKILSKHMEETLKRMKGFRNVLVHKYGEVNDELVFENLDKLNDFDDFKEEIISFVKREGH